MRSVVYVLAMLALLVVPATASAWGISYPDPNPFCRDTTSTTKWQYTVDRDAYVSMVIQDVDHVVVRTLMTMLFASTGSHDVTWNGTDDTSQALPDGEYYFQWTAYNLDQTPRFEGYPTLFSMTCLSPVGAASWGMIKALYR